MPRDPAVFLDDIVESCKLITSYIEGLSDESFLSDQKTLDAVVRNLEIIGEAVKQLPPEIRAAMPDVEWQRIAGLRDILIHGYFAVDAEIVLDIARTKVPLLRRVIEDFLGR